MDPKFTVEVISQTPNPQQTIYSALHQDYAEGFVWDELFHADPLSGTVDWMGPSESKCGEIAINSLLNGGRGHFGSLEHSQIVFNVGWFPHSTMQQIRTHRVGVSFDCQSFRYTGSRIVEACKKGDPNAVEELFYLRPLGEYTDRQGKKYEYTESERESDIACCVQSAFRYADKIKKGFSEEHARGLIPFDIRQHWVMSANVRSLMHLLDLRWKKNAQLECQQLCDLIWPHFQDWCPELANWYMENRAKKARLAP